jgi:hypothetical protein
VAMPPLVRIFRYMKGIEIKKHTTYDGYDYYSLQENGKPVGISSPSYESILKEKLIEEK